MSKVTDNVLLRFNKGGFAKTIVYRTMNDKTFSCKYPDMSNVVPSKNQTKGRERFAKAVKYAKSALKDPDKKEFYGQMKAHSPYHAAVKDYMNQFNAERPVEIVLPQRIQAELQKFSLSEQQHRAVQYIQRNKMLTNKLYQEMNEVSKPTATRHLQELVQLNIIQSNGAKGAGSKYIIGSWLDKELALIGVLPDNNGSNVK